MCINADRIIWEYVHHQGKEDAATCLARCNAMREETAVLSPKECLCGPTEMIQKSVELEPNCIPCEGQPGKLIFKLEIEIFSEAAFPRGLL